MNRGLKIAISIATIGIIGTASYLIYKKIKDNRDAEKGSELDEEINTFEVVQGNDNSNEKTPFKNKAQSDLFRQFVNRFYPSYAQEIDLDLTGDSDNAFMRKAWGKYGETYKKFNPSFAKASGSSIPKVLLDAYALRKDKGSFSNNSEGAIFLQTKELSKIDNQKVTAYFYSNGKVSIKKGGKRIRYVNWSNNGKMINSDMEDFKGTDYYNTAFKVSQFIPKSSYGTDSAFVGDLEDSSIKANANLQGDLEAPPRKGLGLDLNIID